MDYSQRNEEADMELGINARVEDVKLKLVGVINESHLPFCITNYILTEILNEVRLSQLNAIQQEREAFEKGEENG